MRVGDFVRVRVLIPVKLEVFSPYDVAISALFIGEKRLLRHTPKMFFFYLSI